jgi:hypothetical protein
MDPRERADALLSRAQARDALVVTPDNAISPMDASNTQQIPRSVVSEIDRSQDPDTTTKLPASVIEANDHHLASSEPTTPLDLNGATRSEPADEPAESHLDGLIPTTRTTNPGRSELARRLEGL